jgi:hypothetical protein
MVPTRTGSRIVCDEDGGPRCIGVLAARFADLRRTLVRLRAGLFRIGGALLFAAQHQHIASALDAARGLADDARERVGGVALDARHRGHRQARRISAVDARGDQLVAVLDFGVGRHEAQFQHAAGAGAKGDRAQSVAHHLHRNCLLLVREQRHLRRQGVHARHLADHAILIHHRRACVDAALAAPVDHHLARVRVAAVVEDLGGHRLERQALGGARQAPELPVLGQRRLVALRGLRRAQQFRAQLDVLLAQLRLADEVARHPVAERRRQGCQRLQRIDRVDENAPQAFGVTEARVQDQQREGKGGEKRKAHERRGAAIEEGRRRVLHRSPGVPAPLLTHS